VSSKWYAKFVYALTAVEFWHARIPEIEIAPKAVIAKEACFSKARQLIIEDLIADLHGECRLIGLIFASLNMIGQVKFGMLKISDALVKNSLQSEETSDVLRLKAYYEQIFKVCLDRLPFNVLFFSYVNIGPKIVDCIINLQRKSKSSWMMLFYNSF
jgi:hypothetical protein